MLAKGKSILYRFRNSSIESILDTPAQRFTGDLVENFLLKELEDWKIRLS